MGKPVSNDLRLRIVRRIASGKSRRAAAAQFDVAPSTAVRVQARYAATGSVEPARQGRPKGSGKLAPFSTAILNEVKTRPDITMPDLAAWLAATHGVSVDPSNLSKFLCRHGFSYKKNPAGVGDRTLRRQGGPSDMARAPPTFDAPTTRPARLPR
jgi:transposase